MIPSNKKKNSKSLTMLGQEDLRLSNFRKDAIEVLKIAKSQEDESKPIKTISKGKIRYTKP